MTFRRGIVSGFGEPIPLADLAWLREHGCALIRQDGRAHGRRLDPHRCVELAREVIDAGMACLFICHHLEQIEFLAELARGLPSDLLMAEWGNEPDLEGPVAEVYATTMHDAADVAAARGLPLYVGAISNFNKRGLNYLRALRPTLDQLPPETRVSIHRYANGETPVVPHKGFVNRFEEVQAFKAIIGTRRWALTEFGFTDSVRIVKGFWPWSKKQRRWTPQQVAQFVRDEFERWDAAGADFSCLYQLNDEFSGVDGENYGIRTVRYDGSPGEWKPVAETFR
jgi:hypothetical protein